jgi:pSer/pThr/pTyr-binding forkhead associated (FHA) protein
MFQLNIIDASGREWKYPLSRDSICTIGRSRNNNIVLDDLRVSRFHAHIKYEEGAFVLVDGVLLDGELRRSAGRVFINGEPVYEHRLNNRDQIAMGASTLRFIEQDDESLRPTVVADQSLWSNLENAPASPNANEPGKDASASVAKVSASEERDMSISLDSVKFDETGFTYQGDGDHFRVWSSPSDDQVGLFLYSIRPDLAARVDNPDELRNFYRPVAETAGLGIIEVECRQVDRCAAVRTIFKAPQAPSGRTYLGSLTFPFAAFSFVLKVQCAESGTTGLRDTMVLMQSLANSEVGPDSETGQIPGWVQDPYDPALVSAMTMNRSERAEYDAMFPEHPLSRLRQLLAHLEATIRLSEEVKRSEPFVFEIAEGS